MQFQFNFRGNKRMTMAYLQLVNSSTPSRILTGAVGSVGSVACARTAKTSLPLVNKTVWTTASMSVGCFGVLRIAKTSLPLVNKTVSTIASMSVGSFGILSPRMRNFSLVCYASSSGLKADDGQSPYDFGAQFTKAVETFDQIEELGIYNLDSHFIVYNGNLYMFNSISFDDGKAVLHTTDVISGNVIKIEMGSSYGCVVGVLRESVQEHVQLKTKEHLAVLGKMPPKKKVQRLARQKLRNKIRKLKAEIRNDESNGRAVELISSKYGYLKSLEDEFRSLNTMGSGDT